MGRDDLIKRNNDLVRLCGNHTYQPIIKNTREFLEHLKAWAVSIREKNRHAF